MVVHSLAVWEFDSSSFQIVLIRLDRVLFLSEKLHMYVLVTLPFISVSDLGYPAHLAAYAGDLEHLKSLIEKGVSNINEQDEKGSTVAHKGD